MHQNKVIYPVNLIITNYYTKYKYTTLGVLVFQRNNLVSYLHYSNEVISVLWLTLKSKYQQLKVILEDSYGSKRLLLTGNTSDRLRRRRVKEFEHAADSQSFRSAWEIRICAHQSLWYYTYLSPLGGLFIQGFLH